MFEAASTLPPAIAVTTAFLESPNPALPSLVLQVTSLVESYMLWIGISDGSSEGKEKAVMQGSLCKDWAVGMPPKTPGTTVAATSLFRASNTDVALGMAQRLAKRFQKQIYLSVDFPSSVVSFGRGHELLLQAEKGIVETLKGIEGS